MRARKPKRRQIIKQFPKGRICKKHGCKHVLSVYNSEVYCRIHSNDP